MRKYNDLHKDAEEAEKDPYSDTRLAIIGIVVVICLILLKIIRGE